MTDGPTTHSRKQDHVDIVRYETASIDDREHVFDRYQLPYRTLPEIALEDVDTRRSLLGKELQWPFIISSMTGGMQQGATINRHLAIAAERMGVAMGLGSMRILHEDPGMIETFGVRELCPSIPLFANIGLVQLNYGFDAEVCNRLVQMVQADALFFHTNALQEVVQPEGDTNFRDLLDRLAALVPQIDVTVYIKEVGNGIDPVTAQALLDIGVAGIDVSGRGGTSWPAIEGKRRGNRLGEVVRQLGWRTDQTLQRCVQIDPEATRIAGGGLRSGIDVLKAIVMGASFGTAGSPFLSPAIASVDAVCEELQLWHDAFRIGMFSCGVQTVDQLATLDRVV